MTFLIFFLLLNSPSALRYFETSAATGEGVMPMFEALLQVVLERQRSAAAARKPSAGVRKEEQTTDIYRRQSRS